MQQSQHKRGTIYSTNTHILSKIQAQNQVTSAASSKFNENKDDDVKKRRNHSNNVSSMYNTLQKSNEKETTMHMIHNNTLRKDKKL